MADSIQVSTQVLRDTASKIRTINATMNSQLTEINKAMNDLESTWRSDAALDIRAAMNALRLKFFEGYKNIIDSYAKFLDNTAQNYETTEGAIQSNASAFK